ncbi:threonine/serine exporter family protein [Effusibacillus pohliae]|uniref:threonine/serine exporter family protein n=1 Tax=Effusibacillus pohliae TaxID=232270 RepID=UPI0003A1FA31|nr:threonine/serine exporter family protein [Effusibacillus pohliae]
MTTQDQILQTVRICLKAGALMLKNGAETARVEETIERIGVASGVKSVYSFVTPTGIFISVTTDAGNETRMYRIGEGLQVDLTKVARINELSRRLERGQITLQQVWEQLLEIETAQPEYPMWLRQLCAALSGGGFTILYAGGWADFLPGAICAWLANYLMEVFDRRMPRFLAVFFAAFCGTLLAGLLVKFGFGERFYPISLGTLVPLLPGLAVTNSVRDLMANDLLSGVARSAEAFLTAFAIAIAVALVFALQMGGVFR